MFSSQKFSIHQTLQSRHATFSLKFISLASLSSLKCWGLTINFYSHDTCLIILENKEEEDLLLLLIIIVKIKNKSNCLILIDLKANNKIREDQPFSSYVTWKQSESGLILFSML